MPTLRVAVESWALREPFRISRGVKTAADVVVVELADDVLVGRGECVPYARYGETVATVLASIEMVRSAIEAGATTLELARLLPAGAARNALDCALWDLAAKRSGKPVWQLLGLLPPAPQITAYTLSLDTAENMAAAAQRHAHRPLLKLKLDADAPLEKVAAVRKAAPNSRLVIDANEAWTLQLVEATLPRLRELGVELLEQPLAAGQDVGLAALQRAIPLAADESCHVAADLAALRDRYDIVNIKLDKAGGLTEAHATLLEARRLGFKVFVGCMVATSLAMAPAMLLAAQADYVDLDGPLLLAQDRAGGLRYQDGLLHPVAPTLWGG